VRSVKEEEEIIVTDRGRHIAVLGRIKNQPSKTFSWAKRPLLPGYAKYLREGKVGSDSSAGISADRTSRDRSVAGVGD
jgi:antitoxin (DNA-binding transcriptional repressor) of toxin-antitoxin stability system